MKAASVALAIPHDVAVSMWGDTGCGMPPLFTCMTDSDCTSRALGAQEKMKCMGSTDAVGVCIIVAQSNARDTASPSEGVVHCVRHLDCGTGTGKMCAGDGRCVEPVVAFKNSRNTEIEMHMYAPSCNVSERRETFGHSPWEQVPDVLRAHGMCSHRKWFEYRRLLSGNNSKHCSQAVSSDGGIGDLGGGTCMISPQDSFWAYSQSLGLEPVRDEKPLQQDGILSVHAHTCDRDFMYLKGYAECQPRSKVVMRTPADETEEKDINPGRSFATYTSRKTSEIPYTRMPFFRNKQASFFGTERLFSDLGAAYGKAKVPDNPLSMIACSSIPHCALQPFTIRGAKVPRRKVTTLEGYVNDYRLKMVTHYR